MKNIIVAFFNLKNIKNYKKNIYLQKKYIKYL